jgi:hypothetical protein
LHFVKGKSPKKSFTVKSPKKALYSPKFSKTKNHFSSFGKNSFFSKISKEDIILPYLVKLRNRSSQN